MIHVLENKLHLTGLKNISVNMDFKIRKPGKAFQCFSCIPMKGLIFLCCFPFIFVFKGMCIVAIKTISWLGVRLRAMATDLCAYVIDETLALVEGLVLATLCLMFLVGFFALIYNVLV